MFHLYAGRTRPLSEASNNQDPAAVLDAPDATLTGPGQRVGQVEVNLGPLDRYHCG
jgi:hypothetical protein